jgi:hypothetical protein
MVEIYDWTDFNLGQPCARSTPLPLKDDRQLAPKELAPAEGNPWSFQEVEQATDEQSESLLQHVTCDLVITDLLYFLQGYQASCPNLWMVCPLTGVPLPYIHIDLNPSTGLSAKIELSLRLAEAFISYKSRSRAAASEVSH